MRNSISVGNLKRVVIWRGFTMRIPAPSHGKRPGPPSTPWRRLAVLVAASLVCAVGAETVIDVEEHCVDEYLGPVCNFTGVDDVVVMQGQQIVQRLPYYELEIHNAVNGVHIYPTCISWVQIYNSVNVSTRSEEGNTCKTWLRAYNTSLDYVAHGVKDLTLYGSFVREVRLKDQRDFTAVNSTIMHVEDVSWKGYPGVIRNSTIGRISKMTVKDDFTVYGSHIGKISSRAISIQSPRKTEIANTTVDLIEFRGFSIDSSFVEVKLTNVTIGQVAKNAFVVTPIAKLHFQNVTIIQAAKPFIKTMFPESITMDQVTIGGKRVTSMSGLYDASLGLGFDPNDLGELDLSVCKSNETTYECNLSNKDHPVVITVPPDIQTLVLRGGFSVLLENSSCPRHLILDSHRFGLEGAVSDTVNWGLLFSSDTTTPRPTSTISHCDLSLDATMSEIDVLDGVVSTVRIEDSVIHNMRLDNAVDLSLTSTAISSLYKLVIRNNTKASFSSVTISTLMGLELLAGAVLENFIVQKFKSKGITVDHDGETSVVRNVQIHSLEDSSIVIVHGSLVLEDVTVERIKPKAFKLSPNTFLELRNVSITFQNTRLFYVYSRDQVKIKQVTIDGELIDTMPESRVRTYFYVYGHDLDFGDDVIYLSKDKKNCNYSFPSSVFCDYSHATETPVILDSEATDSPHLAIYNAKTLIILPTCYVHVGMSNILNGSTVSTPSTCTSWYLINNSTFTNLTTGFHGLEMSYSTVGLLAPVVAQHDMLLLRVNVHRVEGLTGEESSENLDKSPVVEAVRGQSSGSFVFGNSHIGSIESNGMMFNADAVILSCTIDQIKTSGIVFTKNLIIKNTTITRLEQRAILSHGILILNNVVILESAEESILASDKGGVAFYNVTVGGRPVHWVGYISEKSDMSAVFLNKKQEADGSKDDEATVPEDTDASDNKPLPESATTLAPPVDPAAEAVVSASATRGAAVTPVPETSAQIDNLEVPQQSLTWTGVGVGLLVGLFCSVAMVAVYIACSRSGRGRMLGPVMSWRSAEDRDELLVNDLSDVSVGGEAAAPASTSSSAGATVGYQEVPRSDRE
ncbi:uncharacterized protein LOC143026420 isoform X2 [Oratosquilla oratoria]|uniref:uncharacterized protein LOC143026420 isoform X2 n=1 Tax=Oratosquilla oratoria TaxID=337810 RepID=UPI003F768927